MNSADIYWNIEMLRERRGMTKKEFCRIFGISEKTWSNYEDNPKNIRFGIAEKAAHTFAIPLEEITGRRYTHWREI